MKLFLFMALSPIWIPALFGVMFVLCTLGAIWISGVIVFWLFEMFSKGYVGMNPYAILAAILIFVASLGGAYFKGKKDAELDALVIQQAANIAAVEALVSLREELRPQVYSYHTETTKYPDCQATKEGHKSLLEISAIGSNAGAPQSG